MEEHSSEDNPYASPRTEVVDQRKKFRWRLIPVTLLSVYGILLLVATVWHFCFGVWLCFTEAGFMELRAGSILAMLLGDVVGMNGAIILLFAAFALKRGRWRMACFAFLLGVCVTSCGTFLGGGT